VSGKATHRKPQVPGQHSEAGQRLRCASAGRGNCRSCRRSVPEYALLCEGQSLMSAQFRRTIHCLRKPSSTMARSADRALLEGVGVG